MSNLATEEKDMVVNTLISLVRFRLSDTIKDAEDLKSVDIRKALDLSLAAFNSIPEVTYISFTEEENTMQISDLLVSYACYILLFKLAISEKGREFRTVDDHYNGTELSGFFYDMAKDLREDWIDRVRELKASESFYKDA